MPGRLCMFVLSRARLFETLWTVAYQDPLSMWFSRQEYWKGLPFPTPGDLRNPGIKPTSLVSPALAGQIFTTSSIWPITQHIILAQERKLINIIYKIEIQILNQLINKHSQKKNFFLAAHCGIWDLRSLTRDWTCAPCIGRAES